MEEKNKTVETIEIIKELYRRCSKEDGIEVMTGYMEEQMDGGEYGLLMAVYDYFMQQRQQAVINQPFEI